MLAICIGATRSPAAQVGLCGLLQSDRLRPSVAMHFTCTSVAVYLSSPAVVSRRMAWENIYMAEVVRSCPEMCRQGCWVHTYCC